MVVQAQDYALRPDFTYNTINSVYSDNTYLDAVGEFHRGSPACVPVKQITFVSGVRESFVSDYGISQDLGISGSQVE